MPRERRNTATVRIPFVRRCSLWFGEAAEVSAFLVNINVLGAYVAIDDMPLLGQHLRCSFRLPGSERRLEVGGIVAWNNPKQQHPVHSLPPGFGLSFRDLSDDGRTVIESLVAAYETRR
jgi:Tfp pilus assembly protein PilZ